MRVSRTLSLLLIALLLGSGYVTLCPEGHDHNSEVHFITEPCDSHDCSRSAEAQSCEKDDCEHGLCSDTPVSDEFIVSQIDRHAAVSSVSTIPPGDFNYPVYTAATISCSSSPPVPPQRCNAVLRI